MEAEKSNGVCVSAHLIYKGYEVLLVESVGRLGYYPLFLSVYVCMYVCMYVHLLKVVGRNHTSDFQYNFRHVISKVPSHTCLSFEQFRSHDDVMAVVCTKNLWVLISVYYVMNPKLQTEIYNIFRNCNQNRNK